MRRDSESFLSRFPAPLSVVAGAAALACGPASYGVVLAPYTLQPVVIVPSDRADNARGIAAQLAAMDARMAAISHWFSMALGIDARLHVRPAAAIYTVRPVADFTNVSDTTWFDRAKNVADNDYSVGSSTNPHIIAGAVWGGDAKALATNDLDATGGGFAMVSTFATSGTLAHEIGHAFGLDHPAVNNPVTGTKDNGYTVMYDFVAWPSYPNNPADPSWNLRGLHAWDNNGGGMYQDFFMLARRSDWFRDPGARTMRFDPGGAGNIGFGGSGSWQTPGIWSYQSSTTGAGPTTSEAHLTWDNAGSASGADAVVFAGGATSTLTVTVASPVTVSSMTFNSDGYVLAGAPITLTGEAYIAAPETSAIIGNSLVGTDGLYKGQGTVILTGNCGYSGTTLIGAGVLTVGFATTTGSLGPGPVVNHGELRFNRSDSFSVANDISGTGDLTKLNAGVLTLTGALTYEGLTTVNAGTLELMSPLRSTGGVSISNDARVRVAPSAEVLATEQLTLSGTGTIDLTSAKLVVSGDTIGSFDGAHYTGILGMIQSGRGDGTWNGTSGILTSLTDATTSVLTTLAVAQADEAGYAGGTFGGVTVNASDVLVMFTWGGDADLNGELNGDDYFAIDSHVLQSGSVFGFNNGDFDYNGDINGDDYFIIDSNIRQAQSSPPFPTGRGAAFAAVPEPSSLALFAMPAMTAARRIRRRSGRATAPRRP